MLAGERDACLERVRLRNLLDALQVSVPGDERERLPGTVLAESRNPNVARGREGAGLAPEPPARRSAAFEDFQRQRLPGQQDGLRLVVMVMMVFLVLLPPGAPYHPAGNADDNHGRRHLQVGLAALTG